MNTLSLSPSAAATATDRATELRQQRDTFAALLENTSIGLDAIHIRTLQEWLDEARQELARIENSCQQ